MGPAIGWLVGGLTLAERLYGWIFGGTSKRLEKLEATVVQFMPQGDIKEELSKLGKQIGENQGAIKLLHDRGEEVNNGLNLRVGTLEQHNASLTLLPQQVQKLNTDHAVLANEVRTLSGNIDKLSQKQDKHFDDLMQAVRESAYTRGELAGGRQRGE